MAKKIISASGDVPFSKAIVHNQKYTMEIAGQIGLNSETGKLEEGVEEQTKRALENIKEILQEVGWNFENLTKVRIFLTDMEQYSVVNNLYPKYFNENFPTRVVIAVKGLPLGALVEIDCTASGDEVKKE